MLQAEMQDGTRITPATMSKGNINVLKQNKDSYYCPSCKEKVILKIGEKVIAHFAHMANADCVASRGEGEYHKQGKLLLYEWLLKQNLNVELEKYLPDLDQQPDILLDLNGRKIAIEYQCSRVSSEEIISRTNGYKENDIQVIWILGMKLLKRIGAQLFKFDVFSKTMLHQFTPQYPLSIFYFCPESSNLIKIQNLSFLNNKYAVGKLKFHSLNRINIIELFKANFLTQQELKNTWHREKKNFRVRRRGGLYGEELQWHQWLYLKKLYIEQLPSLIHLPITTNYRMNVASWNWQSRLLYEVIDPLRNGQSFSLERARYVMANYRYKADFFPMIHSIKDPIEEYLLLLTHLGYLEQPSETYFKKVKEVPEQSPLSQSLRSDEEIIEEIFLGNEPKSEHNRSILRYTK